MHSLPCLPCFIFSSFNSWEQSGLEKTQWHWRCGFWNWIGSEFSSVNEHNGADIEWNWNYSPLCMHLYTGLVSYKIGQRNKLLNKYKGQFNVCVCVCDTFLKKPIWFYALFLGSRFPSAERHAARPKRSKHRWGQQGGKQRQVRPAGLGRLWPEPTGVPRASKVPALSWAERALT